MEHLKRLRNEFYDTPRMRDLYLYYIHGFSKLDCYADANLFFKLYYQNLEVYYLLRALPSPSPPSLLPSHSPILLFFLVLTLIEKIREEDGQIISPCTKKAKKRIISL
jgi:hypothetical protein